MLAISPVYDDLIDFLIKKATPQEIWAFTPSEEAQQRAGQRCEDCHKPEIAAAYRHHVDHVIPILQMNHPNQIETRERLSQANLW